MCGIAGMASRDGTAPDRALLQSMTAILAHRGPDAEGIHVDGPVGLGHRRLSIIDLSTGAQPMASADGAVWITYNGEIYNFRELRAELESRGHGFRTTSDTEVILAAYDAWGPDCVRRLRGMFAFGIWDARQRRLLLARDRVGIKPLVYAWDGRRLLFASEIKALLEDRALPRTLDAEALRDYLTFGYIPSPRTIFRAIRKLPPACSLVLALDGGEPRVERYWDLAFAPDGRRTEAEWIEGLRLHLRDAVRTHLVSDVPIGAFLSGGMDSSTVVALMAQASAGPVKSFSIGFDEADFDELAYAREVARRYGTDHYELVVKPDALEALPRLAWQLDEPSGDSSALPTYYVAKMTREHVTVALSGDGGDESFAGYRRYARALGLHERLDRFPGLLVRGLLRAAGRLMPEGARGQAYAQMLGAPPLERYWALVTASRSRAMLRFLSPEARAQAGPPLGPEGFQALAREGGTPDYVSTLQYLDIRTYLPEDILTKVDRTSMLVSLEARVPLLDHVLMEYVATIPSHFKMAGGAGKAILKGVMARDLPAAIRDRRKMGFGVPIGAWFRRTLWEYTNDVLLGRRARDRGLLDMAEVGRLLARHRAGGRDLSSQIWTLLSLELWARNWLDGAAARPAAIEVR